MNPIYTVHTNLILSIFMLLVLAYINNASFARKSMLTTQLNLTAYVMIIALMFEGFVNYIKYSDLPAATPLLVIEMQIFSCIYLLTFMLTILKFSIFLYLFVTKSFKLPKKLMYTYIIVYTIPALLILLSTFNNAIFSINPQNAAFEKGDFYMIYIVANGIFTLLGGYFLILNRKYISKLDYITLLTAVTLQVFGHAINAAFPRLPIQISINAAGIILVFITIHKSVGNSDFLTKATLRNHFDSFLLTEKRKAYTLVYMQLSNYDEIRKTMGIEKQENAIKEFAKILRYSINEKNDRIIYLEKNDFLIFVNSQDDLYIKKIQNQFNKYINDYTNTSNSIPLIFNYVSIKSSETYENSSNLIRLLEKRFYEKTHNIKEVI